MLELGLYSAVAPLILLLVASVWMYPPVLEEAVKWVILRLLNSPQRISAWQGAVVGLVFGLSEAVLYSLNGWRGGEWEPLVVRLLLTVPMHALTGSVTAWGMGRGMGLVGLVIAMVLHWLFNRLVG